MVISNLAEGIAKHQMDHHWRVEPLRLPKVAVCTDVGAAPRDECRALPPLARQARANEAVRCASVEQDGDAPRALRGGLVTET